MKEKRQRGGNLTESRAWTAGRRPRLVMFIVSPLSSCTACEWTSITLAPCPTGAPHAPQPQYWPVPSARRLRSPPQHKPVSQASQTGRGPNKPETNGETHHKSGQRVAGDELLTLSDDEEPGDDAWLFLRTEVNQ